jgi:NAD(P)-dependent dehydrogenase (short-subunit alcohol dehydrogenase family)
VTRLAERVALVVGGNGAVGRAVTSRFRVEGAAVVPFDLTGQGDDTVRGDATSAGDVAGAVEVALERHGRLDAVVHCAYWQEVGDAEELSEEGWQRTLDVLLRSVWLCARHAASVMPHGGAIVNISSIQSVMPYRRRVAYAAAKGGVDSLTRELALDLAPRRVRVNAIRPGAIAAKSEASVRARSYPLGRLVEPEDVAAAALFLASDDAIFVTGQTLTVDGGLTIQSAELRDPEIEW